MRDKYFLAELLELATITLVIGILLASTSNAASVGAGFVLGTDKPMLELEVVGVTEDNQGTFITIGSNGSQDPGNVYKHLSEWRARRWGDPLIRTDSEFFNIAIGTIAGTPGLGILFGGSYTRRQDYKTYFDRYRILGQYAIKIPEQHIFGVVIGIVTGTEDYQFLAKWDTGLQHGSVGIVFNVGGK